MSNVEGPCMRPPPVELDGIGGMLREWIVNGDGEEEGRECKYSSGSSWNSTQSSKAHMSL